MSKKNNEFRENKIYNLYKPLKNLSCIIMGLMIPLSFYFVTVTKNIIYAESIADKLNKPSKKSELDISKTITQPTGNYKPKDATPMGKLIVITAPTCSKCADYKNSEFNNILKNFSGNKSSRAGNTPLEIITIDYPADIVSALVSKLLFYNGGKDYKKISKWIYKNQNSWIPSNDTFNDIKNDEQGERTLQKMGDSIIKKIKKDIPKIDYIKIKNIMDNSAIENEILISRSKVDEKYSVNFVPSVFLEMDDQIIFFETPPSVSDINDKIKSIKTGKTNKKKGFWPF